VIGHGLGESRHLLEGGRFCHFSCADATHDTALRRDVSVDIIAASAVFSIG
jgi:hypothetical protein